MRRRPHAERTFRLSSEGGHSNPEAPASLLGEITKERRPWTIA
jgi:hypothetical protein